jgi:putative ATP-dependent endonuclease of OLD family
VFFSYPLDLDMMMLRAFPDAYGVDDADVPDNMRKLKASIFGKGPGMAAYRARADEADHPSNEELATYDELFNKRSKPASHLGAFGKLTDDDITEDCPEPLRALIEKAGESLRWRADLEAEQEG